MGHYMASVNPEAADYLGDADSLPAVGEIVLFHARPGEGRRGKKKFPAVVIGRNDARGPTGLDLLVIYDARDMVDLDSCQRADEHNNSYCWEPKPGSVDAVTDMLQKLREDFDALRGKVFGEWVEPAKSVMDYVTSFEERLSKFEAAEAAKATGKPRRGQ